ncbi:hypothetical protein [Halomonas dongshanensis]|uniref:Uncharacterized protein n=1 Tax=Halomonas dongshanensis TaxID=2890835 RepID=A0ABT2EBZ1_9GAMM|nr:hypothetical protein [Halomonas dongshanensis]MCS2609024.1 hypothetical protein [Halomonas dongshanensis]
MYFDDEQLLRWMKGDSSAVEFIEIVCDVAHKWDDLIDRDKELDDASINKLFFDLLIRLPRNTFYRKNFEHLNSVLMNSISNWQIATEMEREGDDYRTSIAFILRSSYVDLITQASLITGGNKWACAVGKQAREITHSETYSGYLKNLTKESQDRAKRQS